MCNACGCKSAEEFGAEWRGRWDVGNERKSGEDYYFTYYIRKTEANPQAFEVLIRGRSPEGRELIRQASKNPIFRNLRYADKIKIGFFIRNEVNWEGNIIKGHYQVYLPKLVEGKRGKQVFLMTPSNLIMDNYGEPVIEGLYRTKQEAVNAIYYYFDEMEYPFHISNWPLENSWEFNWDEEFEAEEFEAWDANCSVCNGTGWMPKKGDPKKDAKIAKLFGLSIDELTLTPCNAGGKSMGCWSSNNRNRLRRLQRAEEFGAEGFNGLKLGETVIVHGKKDGKKTKPMAHKIGVEDKDGFVPNRINIPSIMNPPYTVEGYDLKKGGFENHAEEFGGESLSDKDYRQLLKEIMLSTQSKGEFEWAVSEIRKLNQKGAETFGAERYKPTPKEISLLVKYLRVFWGRYEMGIYDEDEVLNKIEWALYHTGVMQEDEADYEFGAEEFEATKGMDTYAQPLEELKIKPTKTKVGILLASIVAGGLWYSNKMKE
jgi:hypothetical protein